MVPETASDLVIGLGEVGSALASILEARGMVFRHDPERGFSAYAKPPIGGYDWMHICFPYSESFEKDVLSYIGIYNPQNVVIHSTVPVGTTRGIWWATSVDWSTCYVYYSPVRGIHPEMRRYLLEFPKWYATASGSRSDDFEDHFWECGMQCRAALSWEGLELAKLIETTEYGYRISLWQEIGRMTKKLGVDIDVVRQFLFEKRKVYDGDRGLAPIMRDGPILGHCVEPNYELLNPLMTPEFYTWLKTSNRIRKETKDG